MSELLTIHGLQKEFEQLNAMSCRPDFRKLPKGYITDEETCMSASTKKFRMSSNVQEKQHR